MTRAGSESGGGIDMYAMIFSLAYPASGLVGVAAIRGRG